MKLYTLSKTKCTLDVEILRFTQNDKMISKENPTSNLSPYQAYSPGGTTGERQGTLKSIYIERVWNRSVDSGLRRNG